MRKVFLPCMSLMMLYVLCNIGFIHFSKLKNKDYYVTKHIGIALHLIKHTYGSWTSIWHIEREVKNITERINIFYNNVP